MLETSAAPRTRVARRIAADPTSTALLLAGPASLELWPGLRRVADTDGGVLVEAELRGGASDLPRRRVAVTVSARPPSRTPTAYVTRFRWTAAELPVGTGELKLAYAPTGDGTPVTHALLTLMTEDDDRLDRRTLDVMAEGFLTNLARAAEARSRAA